jgi:cobalt/nickel transport system permease protein
MMQPIHLAIGIVEGLVTAAVVLFVQRARPEILERAATGRSLAGVKFKPVLIGLAIAAVVCGAGLSWFASTNADGLEWSIAKVTGRAQIAGGTDAAHSAAASVQTKTVLLPGYGFQHAKPAAASAARSAAGGGTSVAGLVGAGLTLIVAALLGFALRRRSSKIAGNGV